MATSFDVDTIIAEFLAEPERTSIEFPHMTTGQRKNAKKVLERYPELRCESFGFGPERQLHLFKKNTADVQPEPEDQCTMTMSSQEKFVIASPDCSTIASNKLAPTGGSHVAANSMPIEREIALPAMHEELQVRNTFIHYESTPIDERAVKSMPHGMFKQCIFWESSQVAAPHSNPTSSFEPEAEPTAYPVDEDHMVQHVPLSFGTLVVVGGLTKLPAFNGRTAVVQDFDAAAGRYNILLVSSDGSQGQQAKVKEENLRMAMTCP